MKTKILFAGVVFALFSTASSYAAVPQDALAASEAGKHDTLSHKQDPRLEGLEIRIKALGEAIESLEEVMESDDMPEEGKEQIRKEIEKLEKERKELKEKRNRLWKNSSDSLSMKKGGIDINDDYVYWDWSDKDKKKKKDKKLPNYKTHLLGLDFGFNTLQYTGSKPAPAQVDSLELRPGGSYTFKLHLLQSGVNLIKHKFYMTYSLTFDWQRYSFSKNINLQPRAETLRITSEPFEFDRNTLMAVYFGVPLMFHYETKPQKRSSFHLAAGGFGNFLIDSWTRQKSYEEGLLKIKDDFNLNPFTYGVAAQVGYRRINLYAQYALNPLFKRSEGPSLNNLNFGLTIIGFHWY